MPPMVRFVNAFLLDGRGGSYERSGLRVEDGRIAEVGPQVADGGTGDGPVIDLQGRTLMPGMIDTQSRPQSSFTLHWTAGDRTGAADAAD